MNSPRTGESTLLLPVRAASGEYAAQTVRPGNILDQEKKIKKHLIPFFGSREASTVRIADINAYVDKRLAKSAKPATINRELSNLRRAFQCGFDEHKILAPLPKYKKLDENNVREGFLERAVYRRIMNYLPRHQSMLWCFAYYLGVSKGELLKFKWEWLLPYWNEAEPIIKIPGRYCKNKKPHTIPIYHPEMRAMVEIAITERDPECPYLFQYRGRQLKNIRTGFEAARINAGAPEQIFHDTRRTAVRNMVLAGISEKRAMQISGHRTRSVFGRYDITTERDAIETGKHMRRHWEQIAEQEAANASRADQSGRIGRKIGRRPEECDRVKRSGACR
jgi:integrase